MLHHWPLGWRLHCAACSAILCVEFETWPRCEQLLPHALACAEHIETEHLVSEEADRLLNQTGYHINERAQSPEALPLFHRALAISEQALVPTHPDVATRLSNLGAFYYAQGPYEQALPLQQRALAIDEQAYGPNHPEVATDLENLAVLSRKIGQEEQARAFAARAEAIRARRGEAGGCRARRRPWRRGRRRLKSRLGAVGRHVRLRGHPIPSGAAYCL